VASGGVRLSVGKPGISLRPAAVSREISRSGMLRRSCVASSEPLAGLPDVSPCLLLSPESLASSC